MLTISRTKRVIGWFFNFITFMGLIFGNIILLITKRTTIGGLVGGYKFSKSGSLIMLFLCQILVGLGYFITFGILLIVDLVTMGKRDGTFAEAMSGARKEAR